MTFNGYFEEVPCLETDRLLRKYPVLFVKAG